MSTINFYVASQAGSALDWQESVLSIENDPPGGPSDGDRYLIDTVPTGAWVGHADDLTQWNGSDWIFTSPDKGFAVYVEDIQEIYLWDGSWSELPTTPLSDVDPVDPTFAAASPGIATEAARDDHKHDLGTPGNPSPVSGTTSLPGTGTVPAREDHQHFHGTLSVGTNHAPAIDGGANGFMTGGDKTKLNGIDPGAEVNAVDSVFGRTGAVAAAASDYDASEVDNDSSVGGAFVSDALDTNAAAAAAAVQPARDLIAGAGMTGGGDLSADRTFDVGANADASIVVNADDIQVGVLASDAQHGARGGGTQHDDVVAAGASGFMTGADKTKLDGIAVGVDLIAGAGLTGGGDLSANRTFDVGANGDASIVVNADDIQVGVLATDAQHGARGGGVTQHANADGATSGFLTAADFTKLAGIATGATDDSYSPAAAGDWGSTVPTTIGQALDLLAAFVGPLP